MQEIRNDLKAIRTDISEIKTLVAVNTVSLTNHMARTEASERRLEKLEYVLIGIFAVSVLGGMAKFLFI